MTPVISTGTANTASVLSALRRVGLQPELCEDADRIAKADRVVLPGVGSFGAVAPTLGPVAEAVHERMREGRPLLAICLGLQLLTRASEESPGIAGLGAVDTDVRRFQAGVRCPHLGWNRVTPTPGATLLTEGYAYFAHSFHLAEIPAGWEGATTDHGGPVAAAIERGPILACQFHPELSSRWGLDLLTRWKEAAC